MDRPTTKIRGCRRSGLTWVHSSTPVHQARMEFKDRSSLRRLSTMALCSRENGMSTPTRETARGPRYGRTGHSMKDTGETTRPMERVDSFMQMAMCTRASGRTTRLTGMVSTCTRMGRNTRATGKKTNNMERERRPGPMALSMRVTTSRERKMETEILDGLTDPPTMDSSQITI